MTVEFGRNHKPIRGQLGFDGVDDFEDESSAIFQTSAILRIIW